MPHSREQMKGDLQNLRAKDINLAGDKGEQSVIVLVDTGASFSMVRADLATKLGTPTKLPRPVNLTIGDSSKISITDAVLLTLQLGGQTLMDYFLVFDKLIEEAVLGVNTMKKYGLKIDLEHQAIYAEITEESPMKDFFKKLFAAVGVSSSDEVSEDKAIELVKAKFAAAPAIPKTLLALLDLKDEATEAEVRGAIMALKFPGNVVSLADHDVLKLRCEALEIDSAVLAAVTEGNITPAEKETWLKDLKEGKEKLDTFAAFIKRRGKVVPLQTKLPAKTEDKTSVRIDDAQAEVNRQLGISTETFAKYSVN